MRGRPSGYRSINGTRVDRWRFEWWVCFAAWTFILQGYRERGEQPMRGAFPQVYRLVKRMKPLIPGLRIDSALGLHDLWHRLWRSYPSAFHEAWLFASRNNAVGSFARLTRPAREKVDEARRLAAADWEAWAAIDSARWLLKQRPTPKRVPAPRQALPPGTRVRLGHVRGDPEHRFIGTKT